MTALHGVAQVFSTRWGQRQILFDVLDVLEAELDFVRGAIVVKDAQGQDLVVEAGLAPGAGPSSAGAMGLVEQVMRTGEPAAEPEVAPPARRPGRLSAELPMVEAWSLVGVPVLMGTEVIGGLAAYVGHARPDRLETDRKLLAVVAALLSADARARRMGRAREQALEAENLRLRGVLEERFRPENLVGHSHAMQAVYQAIRQLAPLEGPVLLRGEAGVGKSLVASAIHYASPRSRGPMVRLDDALGEVLLEAELFGHEADAFRGAGEARSGRLEQAAGGSLLIGEVGALPLGTQRKLLRVLQEGQFERLGSQQSARANVRLLAATRMDLEAAVEKGEFLADLYHRLGRAVIVLPPLRARSEDVVLLANHFLDKHARRTGKAVHRISAAAVGMLLSYPWPGNVRELEGAIERAVLHTGDGVIHAYNLPATLQGPGLPDATPASSLRARVQLLEKDMILDALQRAAGNVSAAARELGITGRMVRYKMRNLGIEDLRAFRRQG